MVEGGVQRERVKMIPEQVFVEPTEQVFAEKCHELIPDPSNSKFPRPPSARNRTKPHHPDCRLKKNPPRPRHLDTRASTNEKTPPNPACLGHPSRPRLERRFFGSRIAGPAFGGNWSEVRFLGTHYRFKKRSLFGNTRSSFRGLLPRRPLAPTRDVSWPRKYQASAVSGRQRAVPCE
jgi:hypothetical protein